MTDPAFGTSRRDVASAGEPVADLMGSLGIDLMGWQRLVLDVGLELEGGWPAHRTVTVSTPRQNGKSTLMLAVVLGRLCSFEGQILAYGAQDRLAARSKLLDVWWPWLQRSPIGDDFTVSRGMGIETLRHKTTGSILKILSSSPSSGHGDALDLAIVDECWALDVHTEQAISPTLIARDGSQLWLVSTAGDAKSDWWRSKIESARESLDDPAAGAFFEWSAPEGADPEDREVWQQSNPALGHTLSLERLESQFKTMRLPEFCRAHLNQFTEGVGGDWSFVSDEEWAAVTW